MGFRGPEPPGFLRLGLRLFWRGNGGSGLFPAFLGTDGNGLRRAIWMPRLGAIPPGREFLILGPRCRWGKALISKVAIML